MNGYAAAARIRSVSPHLAGGTRDLDEVVPGSAAETDALVIASPDDLVTGPGWNLSERWAAARERWSQLTFYLTDPNSWR